MTAKEQRQLHGRIITLTVDLHRAVNEADEAGLDYYESALFWAAEQHVARVADQFADVLYRASKLDQCARLRLLEEPTPEASTSDVARRAA